MNFLFSQEQAVESSQAECLDGERSGTLNGTNTARRSSRVGKRKGGSTKRPSSVMSEHSLVKGTPQAIAEWLTSSVPDSSASRSVSPASVREKWTKEICGRQPIALLRPSSRVSSTSKMYQDSCRHDPIDAYVAGLIDGEGSIGIYRLCLRKKWIQYSARLKVSMTEKALQVLQTMKESFGGILHVFRQPTTTMARSYEWRLHGNMVLACLKRIRPFLILKAKQADIVIALLEKVESLPKRKNGTAIWDDSIRRMAESSKAEINRLNERGPAQHVDLEFVTPQPTLFGTLVKFSGPFPPSGLLSDGAVYRLPKLGPGISGIDCGSSELAPTPNGGNFNDAEDPESWTARADKLKAKSINGNGAGMPLSVWAKLVSTPRSTDGIKGGPNQRGSKGDLTLPSWVMPMPTSRDHKSGKASHETMAKNARPLNGVYVTSRLNPEFSEWLMGWPIGWTTDKPVKSLKWPDWSRCDVSLVTNKKKNRVPRLRAIGNGQVPQCAAEAFRLLTKGSNP